MTLRHFLLLITCLTSLHARGSEGQPNYFEGLDQAYLFSSSEPVCLESIPLDAQLLIAPHDLSYQDVMTPTNDVSIEPSSKQIPGKAHPCTFCNKSFTRPSHLKVHILTHTGEKPHQCSLCNLSFAQKSDLTKHSYIHTGGKCYPCAICGTPFTRNSDLTRHLNRHLEVQSYPCVTCGKSFTTKSNLTRHIKKHTCIHAGEKDNQPQVTAIENNDDNTYTMCLSCGEMCITTELSSHQCNTIDAQCSNECPVDKGPQPYDTGI